MAKKHVDWIKENPDDVDIFTLQGGNLQLSGPKYTELKGVIYALTESRVTFIYNNGVVSDVKVITMQVVLSEVGSISVISCQC